MDNVQAISEYREIPKSEVLAALLVHETSHLLDDKVASEKWFDDRFDYSSEMVTGKNHTAHKTITPKDESQHSHPVSEYGAVNSFEDLAESATSYLGTIKNWKITSDEYQGQRHARSKDAYRHELVLELMNKAAAMAAAAGVEGASGTVSSRVKYEKDTNGEIHTVPDHSYEWQSDDGVIKREIDALVSRGTRSVVTYAVERDDGI